jgi:predicted nuclease of predicted toxin-antitoxin system
MRLLLDECIGDRSLTNALVADGHDVVRSVDALGGGVDDSAVFAFAQQQNRILVTYNNVDFARLGQANLDHPGMVLIYQENKRTDMNTAQIVKALSNVGRTHPDGIAGTIVVLNAYRW